MFFFGKGSYTMSRTHSQIIPVSLKIKSICIFPHQVWTFQ